MRPVTGASAVRTTVFRPFCMGTLTLQDHHLTTGFQRECLTLRIGSLDMLRTTTCCMAMGQRERKAILETIGLLVAHNAGEISRGV